VNFVRLVFIDESGDKDRPEYLGLSVATVDARYYPLLKRRTHEILLNTGWERGVEFKGSILFSATKGCPKVTIEDRVRIAGSLLDLNTSEKNSRMRFTYGRLRSANQGLDYLTKLPSLLDRALPTAPKGPGKDLLAVTCDERSDVSAHSIHETLAEVVEAKGYVLLERVVMARSGFDTVGLMFADLVGYLSARIDNTTFDADLFGLPPEEFEMNPRLRKFRTSSDLIAKVKKLTVLDHKISPA
jgi:hypothetical protein